MNDRSIAVALAGTLALGAGACSKRDNMGDDKTNVASDFENTQYQESIVTAKERNQYDDQGKGIKPTTLSAIEHTIKNVYERDFERCLEEEMDRQQTRFLRSVFTVQMTIETAGNVTASDVLDIKASKQDAKGADKGPIDPAELKDCVKASMLEWTFDPAPEVKYVHTYRYQVGEAF